MSLLRLALLLSLIAWSTPSFAQPPRILPGNSEGTREGKHFGLKDVEGVVWEFKVIDEKTKKTESTGRFRVKEDALFLVRMKRDVVPADKPADDKGKLNLRDKFAKKLDESAQTDPTERIGEIDVKYKNLSDPSELRLIFDNDDEYELSGRAVIKRTSQKSTIWTGRYDDQNKKRWKFEVRKIEE